MTEKEKKSTENLNKLVQQRKDKTNTITIKYDNCICSTKELDIALNLIQRQQEENIEYHKYLNKLLVMKNSISLICFTILAIIFNKWWIVFFSLLFTVEIKSKESEDK